MKLLHKVKKFLLLAALAVFAGCTPDEMPARISKVGELQIGTILAPRHGEGELFEFLGKCPPGFDRMLAECVPFDHQVFRIVLEIRDVKNNDNGDPLTAVRGQLEKFFNIRFDTVSPDEMRCRLAETIVTLRRSFYLGPRAVSLEFVDLKLAAEADAGKKSMRYQQVRRWQYLHKKITIAALAIEDFRLDNGSLPYSMADLKRAPAGCRSWRGPYLREEIDSALVYRKTAPEKYELYAVAYGRKISEDTQL